MKKQTYGWGLLALGIVLTGALVWTMRDTVERDTQAVSKGDIEINVSALGTLQPRSYVDVGAQVSGQIRRIHVAPGSHVEKGELLIEIDPSIQQAVVDSDRATLAALKAQLMESQAQSELAGQQHRRQQQLAKDDATREEDVQTALASWRAAEARVDNLRAQIEGAQSTLKGHEAQLGYTRIYAPMAGTVVSLEAREGQTLNATYQTPMILRIADLSSMTVWAEVSEVDVTRVKPGMPVYFTRLGTEQRRWQGKVRQVLPAPPTPAGQGQSSETKPAASSVGKVVTYTVLFDVTNADGDLMPQMTAQVFFVVSQALDVVMAPMQALHVKTPGEYEARVLNKAGKIEVREVRIGLQDRIHGEVLQGLQPGDQVVTGERNISHWAERFQW
ncbi:efflux RND transporter periplasmic adaptor subunit [Methylovorus menthalis]|uniref:efflux RND transporter periplasmic adaptor subunit n=1 Tax=Methylovorus menthalis TaxID=1002227 RepID=UPI001E3D4238|nr:efflux RND transporter periplasmic adaptor subunit [Methylovorus menthalis]MCB4810321.1 efflux RND transporter periplasmic adaptor subunit [Methylovorus menthalis]